MRKKKTTQNIKNKFLFFIILLLIISGISIKLYFFTIEINYKRQIGKSKQEITKQQENLSILKQKLNDRQSLNEIDKAAKQLLHMESNIETIYINEKNDTDINANK